MQPCPTDDLLGAHMEHALDEHEASRVASHLDECEVCRAVVIAAVRESRTRDGFARGTPSVPAFAPRSRSLVGTRMGRYELRALLGAGGMGQVYAAFDAELDREIAVKVLHPELARSAAVLADRLVRESRLMAKIAHPSVITVYDVGRTEDDAVFIAMALVRGETLGAYLARTKLGWRDTVKLFERAGAGLAAAHAAGIVHRDFKPDNVLVEGEGANIVVTDFGIAFDSATPMAPSPARVSGTDRMPRLTATGVAIGTPAYMAPEQLANDDVDARADVFAFSVSLWEALFGERPFRGANVDAIRAAMLQRPRANRGDVPARLVRALERGLAIAPADRWPDMGAMLRELAAISGRQRRKVLVAAVASLALVGAGIVGARLLSASERDPCAATLPSTIGLALEAKTLAELDQLTTAWRTTHASTCKAENDPPQLPAVATCLDARRTEIDAFVEETRRSGAKAAPLIRTIGKPARCLDPRSGLLVARAPADRSIRAAVADIRYRAFAIEAARDRSDLTAALRDVEKLAAETTNAWPMQRAEILYLLGSTQSLAGDNVRGMATLRETAAFAERVHHDYIATNTWLQLIQSASFDEGDPERGLEYATYADAALDRIGRPSDIEVLFLYYYGTTLVEAGRPEEAEPKMRRSVELAEKFAPQYLAQALLGLGHLLESQNRYSDATDPLRRALAGTTPGDPANHTFHERLAMNLALTGHTDEAEVEARKAIALVDSQLTEDSTDRAVAHASLAQVLQKANKMDAALVEVRVAADILRKSVGERNLRYGELISLEANILLDVHRFKEADPILARACEIIAFGIGDDTASYADCLLSRAIALEGLKRVREAVAVTDRALAILIADGEQSARTANAYLQRGQLREAAGKRADAIADIDRAIAIFSQLQLDAGHLAAAQMLLADLLWERDRSRAKALSAEAMQGFTRASASWDDIELEAVAWMKTHQ